MTQQLCATGCGRPTGGSTLCRDCEDTFVREVGQLAGIADDLRTAVLRQAVFGARYGGTRSAETAVPFDQRASRARDVLLAASWRWVLRIWDHQEPLPRGAYGGLAGAGRWLHQRINRLLDHPDAGDLANDVHRHVKRVLRLLDRPASWAFAGVCTAQLPDGTECPTWLYAHPDRDVVTCRTCGAHWDVAARRDFLLEAVEHVLATTTEIAGAVAWFGDSVREDRIRQWASRGRIVSQGEVVDERGRTRPLYRIGDVLKLLRDDADRRQPKAS